MKSRMGQRPGTKRVGTLGAALVVVAALLFAGCGSSSGDDDGGKRNTVVFMPAPRGFNDATRAWANGFDRAGAELEDEFDVALKTTPEPDLDPAHYLIFIRSNLVPPPDGMVVIPNNGPAMTEGLNDLVDRTGVPLLVMDGPVPGAKQVSFVGTNNEEAGAQAAEFLIKVFGEGKLSSNQIAVLGQPPGGSSADERVTGFLDAAKDSPLDVVQITLPKGVDLVSGRTALANVMTAHPELGGVFATSDVYALGAARALEAANKLDIALVSVDATKEGVKYILKNGAIDAEIAQHLEKMGYTAAMTLAKSLKGEEVPRNIDTGTTLVTAENAQEYLQRAKKEAAE